MLTCMPARTPTHTHALAHTHRLTKPQQQRAPQQGLAPGRGVGHSPPPRPPLTQVKHRAGVREPAIGCRAQNKKEGERVRESKQNKEGQEGHEEGEEGKSKEQAAQGGHMPSARA